MEKVCCGCHRVKKQDRWVKRGKGVSLVKLSHGYCPRCYEKAIQKVMAFGAHFQPAID